MSAANEFRGFVYNKQLTALSQYCYYQCFKVTQLDFDWPESCVIQELQDEKVQQDIATRVQAFWKSICDRVPQKNCIVDFVVLPDKVMIIELNPFVRSCSISIANTVDLCLVR